MSDLIEVKPGIENNFVCPQCEAERPVINKVVIPSMHVLADCTCRVCAFRFLQTFPVGHNASHVVSVGKDNNRVYEPTATPSWLQTTMVAPGEQHPVTIRKTVYRRCSEVIILNTLDFLYGHVLLKLYNALYHLDHHSSPGLVVIVPSSFEWLVPTGCAEVWVIDAKLSTFKYPNESIAGFIETEFRRFDKIFLSKAFSHPDVAGTDISRLTGVKPFDTTRWRQIPPTVTFVLREDRWWFSSVVGYWIYRVARKLKFPDILLRALAWNQNRLVDKTIRLLKKLVPDIRIAITGVGKTGTFNRVANDLRQTAIDSSMEVSWCRLYAQSHVVIGFHGSNMLLPTAHSGGAVEILPDDRFGNIVQDLSVRYHDRRQLFLYRFAPQYSSPRRIATMAAAIIKDYPTFQRNMCENIYEVGKQSTSNVTTVTA